MPASPVSMVVPGVQAGPVGCSLVTEAMAVPAAQRLVWRASVGLGAAAGTPACWGGAMVAAAETEGLVERLDWGATAGMAVQPD